MAAAAFSSSPVEETTYAPIAERPKKIEPARLRAAITQPRSSGRHESQPCPASAKASQLATRKQIEPSASGRQESRFAEESSRLSSIARKVLMLKKTVPTSWIEVASQSIRPGSQETKRVPRGAAGSGRAVLTTSRYWSDAALVKKIEPTKNVMPSAPSPTSDT